MGDDVVVRACNEKYGDALTKLYYEDNDKFKKLFNETKDSMVAALKLTNGQPTAEIVNRKLFLDLMSSINAIAAIENYVETSKDDIAVFLRENI